MAQEHAGKILIIDDEQDLVSGVQMLLEDAGYETLAHPSPLGLAFLLRSFNPDVVLLDLGVPTLSGEALLRLERKRIFPTNAAIVLHSGRGCEELASLADAFGVDGYYSKGESVEWLLARLPKWVACRRGRDAFNSGSLIEGNSNDTADLQPLIVVRTDAQTSPAIPILQLAGYLTVKAGSDELAASLVKSCGASTVLVDLGNAAMNRFADALSAVAAPALFVSPIPPRVPAGAGPVVTVPPDAPRHKLLDAIDRLVAAGCQQPGQAAPGLSPTERLGAAR